MFSLPELYIEVSSRCHCVVDWMTGWIVCISRKQDQKLDDLSSIISDKFYIINKFIGFGDDIKIHGGPDF